jgi:lysophospholipase L1-like esterase
MLHPSRSSRPSRSDRMRPAAVLAAGLLVGLAAGFVLTHFGASRAAASMLKQALVRQTSFLPPPDALARQSRQDRLAFFRASPALAEVVMLGDSHSENGPWSELLPGSGVLNRGIGWDTTQDVLDRVDEVIARKPARVFLLIGIVDLRYGDDPGEVGSRIQTIASRLREAGIRTHVQSVLPVAANLREPTNERVQRLNERLRADPDFVDLHPVLVKDGALDPGLTRDGVHLTPAAYAAWTRLIAPLLKSGDAGAAQPQRSSS